MSFLMTLVAIGLFAFARYGYSYEQIGPPIADFQAIVPKGQEVYDYYGLPNPKRKKETQLLELQYEDDPYLNHFSFVDINKVLPFSHPSCPPDGMCSEKMQALMKFHITQSTDLASSSAPGAKEQKAKREVGFFQLEIPRNASRAERESVKELILRNETTTEGDISAEGSIKQLKNLLKNHLVVKPACLFDNSIKVTIKVMFASNGQYSEDHTKTVDFELSQIQKEAVRE